MVFQSDTYSVLLVSASEKMNTAITSLLPSTDFWPLDTAGSVSKARRLLLEKAYDLILVNSPLPDGSGVRFCMDPGADSQTGILLMVKRELYEEIYYKLLPCGVITLAIPTSREVLSQAVRDLCVLRERASVPGAPGHGGGKNGGAAPCQPGQVAADRKAGHDRGRGPSVYPEPGHGAADLQKTGCGRDHRLRGKRIGGKKLFLYPA